MKESLKAEFYCNRSTGNLYRVQIGEKRIEIQENLKIYHQKKEIFDSSKAKNEVRIYQKDKVDFYPEIHHKCPDLSKKDLTFLKKHNITSTWKIYENIILTRVLLPNIQKEKEFYPVFFISSDLPDLTLEWTIIIPTEVTRLCNLKDRNKSLTIGSTFKETYNGPFNNKTNIFIAAMYRELSEMHIIPHAALVESGTIDLTYVAFKDLNSLKACYSVILKSKKYTSGPKFQIFHVRKNISRFCVLTSKNNWLFPFTCISILRKKQNLSIPANLRFSRWESQALTPVLFKEQITKSYFDEILLDYEVEYIFKDEDLHFDSTTPRKIYGYLDKQEEFSLRFFHQITFIINVLDNIPINQEFDYFFVLDDDINSLIFSFPLVRYLNALPLIKSSELLLQLNKLRTRVKTNLILSFCKEIERIEGFRIINLNKEPHSFISYAKVLFKIQGFDFFVEDFQFEKNENPKDILNVLEIFKDQQDLYIILKKISQDQLTESEYLEKSIIYAINLQLKEIGDLLKKKNDYNLRELEKPGEFKKEIRYTGFKILHQHATLVSLDLKTPQLINVLLYIISRKSYLFPLRKQNTRISKKNIKQIIKIKETTEAFIPLERKHRNYISELRRYEFMSKNKWIGDTVFQFLTRNFEYTSDPNARTALFRYLSIIPSQQEFLYEKMTKPSLDTVFACGRLPTLSITDTNIFILRNHLLTSIYRKKVKILLSTSFAKEALDEYKVIISLNNEIERILKKFDIPIQNISKYFNYQEYLNAINDSRYFFFWGHGTSTYIKLINEDPDVSLPFENFKAELFLQQDYRDKSLCVLTSCLGGEVNRYKTIEVTLPQAMLIYGFRGCIASILKIPSIDAVSFHLSFLGSLLRSPSGVILQSLKKNNFLPANYFIYFGDPTVTFPRLYQTDVTKIVEEIKKITKSFGFKSKEYESPL